MKPNPINIRRITVIALMSALIFVLTYLVHIPIPGGAPNSYVHLGDAGVMFAATAFGPVVAMVAGGLGTAVADVASGAAEWAFFSLLVHGIQGYVVGLLLHRKTKLIPSLLATLASIAIVVGGYYLTELILYGVGTALIGIFYNTLQALAGSLLGIPLTLAVRQAYPQLDQVSGFHDIE